MQERRERERGVLVLPVGWTALVCIWQGNEKMSVTSQASSDRLDCICWISWNTPFLTHTRILKYRETGSPMQGHCFPESSVAQDFTIQILHWKSSGDSVCQTKKSDTEIHKHLKMLHTDYLTDKFAGKYCKVWFDARSRYRKSFLQDLFLNALSLPCQNIHASHFWSVSLLLETAGCVSK